MSFRYLVITKDSQGHADELLEDIEGSELVIGRGGSSQIVLKSRLVSLEHVRVVLEGNAAVIQDLDSDSGLRINDLGASRQELKHNDVLTLADIKLRVENRDGIWTIIYDRSTETQEEVEESSSLAKGLRLEANMPSFTALSVGICALIAVFFIGWPVATGSYNSWSSGPISNQHAMFEVSCEACHAEAFTQVKDNTCEECHQMTDHAEVMPEFLAAHSDLDLRCAQCHMEHNGTAHLTVVESQLCSDCHAQIKTLRSETELLEVVNFVEHPQFRVQVKESFADSPENPPFVRVSLDDKKNLVDRTRIKLNHKIHLEEGLQGPDGPTQLTCYDCHSLKENQVDIEEITFEKNCQSCHPLTFDERLPDTEVPHGNADEVFNTLYAEYAKLFLQSEDDVSAGESLPIARFRPGEKPRETEDKQEFARRIIEEESRAAEKNLFEKTACQLCHYEEKYEDLNWREDERLSFYMITAAAIPNEWMPKAIFDHGAHLEMTCESCHPGVYESEETTDVLMSGVELCRDCHHDAHQGALASSSGMIQSDCVMCHSYHDAEVLDRDKQRDIQNFIYETSRSTK